MKSAGAGEDVEPDQGAHDAWEETVRYLAYLAGPRDFRLSHGGQQLMDAARMRIHTLGQHPGFDSRLRTALQKGEGQLARLALIFHLLEDRTGADLFGEPEPGDEVKEETVAKAVSAYMRLVVPSLCAFYSELVGAGQGIQHARWVANYILAHGCERVTKRDLYRASNNFRDDGSRDLDEAIRQLELAAWVAPEARGHGQAPTAWKVNPRAHAEFSAKACEERARRERVKQEIQKAAGLLSEMSLARGGRVEQEALVH